MDFAIIIIYTFALLLVLVYSLSQFSLLLNYLKSVKKEESCEKYNFSNPSEIPIVTIQLPLYNEMYVVERLLENISKLDYPSDRLEIQVLDDSTDETINATAIQIRSLQKKGLDIKHIIRKDRSGFKAGALKEGLKIAKGEFIAIFDSDFMPKPDWLLQTVPYFKDPSIGVVQTRWGHINRNYSLLTKIQAFALDFHFILEQVGRNFGKHFINFNGTAGIWRKACIMDAGNWSGDTLTEDLDLSYRAQMKKWKFKYLEQVETPAELPVVISAARSQQFRWNKGAAVVMSTTKTTTLCTTQRSIFHADWVLSLIGFHYLSGNGKVFLFEAETLRSTYGVLIGAIFSGVIGTGFYPIFGNRVWCRFGCPMAAILGFQQRLFSRFRITTNGGQCISCGNCSTYCEMGIDVRAYAQKGENIVRSSCVGCGICSAVCPRGVLKLENGSMNGRINANEVLLGNDVNLMDLLNHK